MGYSIQNNRGASLTEFVLVFPTLMLGILFAIEMSLLMVDQHLLSSATLASGQNAVRALTELGPEGEPGVLSLNSLNRKDELVCQGQNCSEDGYLLCGDAIKEQIKRRAAFVMASTAPSVGSVLSEVGIPLPNLSARVDGKYSKNLLRIIEGTPAAYLFTTVSDCEMRPEGLKITLRYYRSGKTPYISSILYGLHALKKITDSNDGYLETSLDENYFGVRASSPKLMQARDKALELVDSFEQMNFKTKDMMNVISNLPGEFGPLKDVLNKTEAFSDGLEAVVRRSREGINNAYSQANDQIRAQEGLLTTILYAVPENFQVVPMTKTMLIAWPKIQVNREDIGEFGSIFHTLKDEWADWAKNLAELRGINDNEVGALGEKYFNE